MQEYLDNHFVNEDFSERNLTVSSFDSCVFEHCSFAQSTLENCSFTNCVFRDCNLLLLKIPNTNFNDVVFERCDMIGVDWTVARWYRSARKTKQNFPISFLACRLDHGVFIGLDLTNIVFDDCSVKEAFFEDASMENAVFRTCDLKGTTFNHTYLKAADFASAKNYDIDIRQNNISRAKFSLPEAMSLIYSLDIELLDGNV